MRSKGLARIAIVSLGLLASAVAAAQNVRFSELHYDNAGTDAGEAIEISGPAGTDVNGWRVLLYNGSNGLVYGTRTLAGTIPATCGARGVLVLDYPENGIQNGAPDAMALVDAADNVVEFLSYEGTLTAADGPALGLTSTDIGVLESGSGPLGESLARNADGTWNASAPHSFGACNDGTEPPPPVASVRVEPRSTTIYIGNSLQLRATALDASGQPIAGVPFTWTSNSPGVASVSASGVATALSRGFAIITAREPGGRASSVEVFVDEPPPPSTSPVRFSEIHYDNVGTDTGEAIELVGPAGTDLTGFMLFLYNGNGGGYYDFRVLEGVIPASCGANGVFVIDFPQDGIQNGSPDGFALFDAQGLVVEFLSYEGTFTATDEIASGFTSVDIGVSQTNAALGTSLQRNSNGTWRSGTASFGACNEDEATPGNSLVITGRQASDVPLPVGFQDQLFARLVDANNQTVPSTFTWTSETPAIATIAPTGVFTALTEGTAILRATAADGTTSTISLPTRVAVPGATAVYGNHAEFGEPADADASDDYIVRHSQYIASYNPNRGTPNWVAYNLEATHFGPEDRCDCFTMDPLLPASFPQLTTADYTDAGAFHGYGIDRGHLVRSFDRTSGSLDNAVTYYFDNIVPQAADLNQGPWAMLENLLGDEARLNNREVYILTGVAGNKGTLKNQGRVVIPTSTWKVAVILPRDQGLASLRDYRDLEVIAVDMPNEPGVRNVDWRTYLTTVDAIEAATGYDLLALLPDDIEQAVESNTQPPIAAIAGPATLTEGASGSFSAAGSIDPDGAIVSYAWSFGDGGAGAGADVTHTFAQDGTYLVTVTVTDDEGLVDTHVLSVTVSNVAPAIAAMADGSATAGSAYTVNGTFTDPGADSWIATVDFGDGTAPAQTTLTGRSFSLSHVYAAAGTYTVRVIIADDDTATSSLHTVTVTGGPGAVSLEPAYALIDGLVAQRKISRTVGKLLKAQVQAAEHLLKHGKKHAAKQLLRALVAQLDCMVHSRMLKAADAAPLRTLFLDVIASLRR